MISSTIRNRHGKSRCLSLVLKIRKKTFSVLLSITMLSVVSLFRFSLSGWACSFLRFFMNGRWILLFFLLLLRTAPMAYGSSQVRCWIGVTVAGQCHSHSNAGSLTHWVRPGIKSAQSWIWVRLVSAAPQWELRILLNNSYLSFTLVMWVSFLFPLIELFIIAL